MSSTVNVALIVNTYNQPEYLARVLESVARQTRLPSEVIVADDGSTDETRQVFARHGNSHPFRASHIWQAKQGFRRSRILNRSIAAASANYLVFLDGDSIPHPRFVEDHVRLAANGAFVQGHRALIEQRAATYFGLGNFGKDRWRALVQGQLRGWKHAYRWPKPLCRNRTDLRGVRGCNLAIWRDDLVRVNGYNEAFVGWGREDSELSLRLMNSGVRRIDVRGWAICYHLWHPPVARDGLATNDRLLSDAIAASAKTCDLGLSQYLTS